MRSVKLATIAGIDVYIHWTFWLLVAIYFSSVALSSGILAGATTAIFILAIFGCVLLHEFGHAAAALAYGIKTPDITILPFGGVARLASIPQKPVQELVIALAGPAVNVVIAAFLLVTHGLGQMFTGPLSAELLDFNDNLLIANVVLVVFNLIPAFPMDGGRVLRSLIAMRSGQLRATEIAAGIGRWLALGFALYAIFNGPFTLLLVAGFVYFAGNMELMQTRLRSAGYQSTARPFVFQFQTSYPPKSGPRPFETEVPWTQVSRDDSVIDAIEVREVKPSNRLW
jgi:Zn-dependent protease